MAPKRILVRAPQWLGDAVVSTVFLKRLKLQHPDAFIAVTCVAGVAPVFASHPDVDEVITLPYPTGSVLEAGKKIALGRFDLVYVLPRSFRAAFESRIAGVPERIGYAGDMRRFFLTQTHLYDGKLLYAHRYLKLIGEETLPLEQVQPYFPSVKPADGKPGSGLDQAKRPILGVAPISVAPSRTWSPQRFADTASAFLSKNGGSVVLFGSPKERERVQQIAGNIKGGEVINTSGQLSLPELGWVMSQCTALLANDSGLMHVAACFKIPSVILFGASDPNFALPPWGRFVSIQHREIFCVPCLKNECVRFGDGHDECMKTISVNEAGSALASLVGAP